MRPKLPYRLWLLVQVGKWLGYFGFLFFEVVLFEVNPFAAVSLYADNGCAALDYLHRYKKNYQLTKIV